MAAPLRYHAKSYILCNNLRGQKIIFEYKLRRLMARLRLVIIAIFFCFLPQLLTVPPMTTEKIQNLAQSQGGRYHL